MKLNNHTTKCMVGILRGCYCVGEVGLESHNVVWVREDTDADRG